MTSLGRAGAGAGAGAGVRAGVVAVFASACLAVAAPVAGQSSGSTASYSEPTIVGGVAGYLANEGKWKPDAESEGVGGIVLGGYANAATSVSWFGIRVELLWSQRGDDVVVPIDGQTVLGGVRGDYLTVAVQPRFSAGLGPVRVHLAVGPVLDQLLRSRVDPTLGPTVQGTGTVFGVGAGAGLGFRVGSRWRVELEARILEGLGDAWSGPFVSMQNRSLEYVVRLGIPRPRS